MPFLGPKVKGDGRGGGGRAAKKAVGKAVDKVNKTDEDQM